MYIYINMKYEIYMLFESGRPRRNRVNLLKNRSGDKTFKVPECAVVVSAECSNQERREREEIGTHRES